MNTVAEIKIWNKTIGAVAWDDKRNYAVFEFDNKFFKNELDVSPITMSLQDGLNGKTKYIFPLLNPDTYRKLPGLLSDSLPDRFGNELINVWLSQHGMDENDFDPVQRLCYIGKRGMGALEFQPSRFNEQNSSKKINVSDLVELAKEVLLKREKVIEKIDSAEFTEIIKVGSSAGGARAKALIAYNKLTGDVRSGQIDGLKGYEYCILKFDGISEATIGEPEGFGRIEYAYYLMAVASGIEMMESEIFSDGKRSHFLTKRFDRINNEKLHMLTLCGIAHYDYNDPNSYSYEQAFAIMRRLQLPYYDKEQLFRRMVFNVIAQNNDDHTKNISFLMDKEGKWKLSPAYDMTFALSSSSIWLRQHQMSINGKRKNILYDDLIAVAKSVGIKKADKLIDEIMSNIFEWKIFAKKAGVSKKQIDYIDKVLIRY